MEDKTFIIKFDFPPEIEDMFTDGTCCLLAEQLRTRTGHNKKLLQNREGGGRHIHSRFSVHVVTEMCLKIIIPEGPIRGLFYVDILGVYRSEEALINYWEAEFDTNNWAYNKFEVVPYLGLSCYDKGAKCGHEQEEYELAEKYSLAIIELLQPDDLPWQEPIRGCWQIPYKS